MPSSGASGWKREGSHDAARPAIDGELSAMRLDDRAGQRQAESQAVGLCRREGQRAAGLARSGSRPGPLSRTRMAMRSAARRDAPRSPRGRHDGRACASASAELRTRFTITCSICSASTITGGRSRASRVSNSMPCLSSSGRQKECVSSTSFATGAGPVSLRPSRMKSRSRRTTSAARSTCSMALDAAFDGCASRPAACSRQRAWRAARNCRSRSAAD